MFGSHQQFTFRFNDPELSRKFQSQMAEIEDALSTTLSLNPMVGLIDARAVVNGKYSGEISEFTNNMQFMLFNNREQNANNRYLFSIIVGIKEEISNQTKTSVGSLMRNIRRFNQAFQKYEQTYSAVFYSEYGFEEGTLKGK